MKILERRRKMRERLAKGTQIQTILNGKVEVVEWLAEGGQGDVFIVDYNGEKKALKWYKENGMGKNKQAFYENLKKNVMKGSPSQEFLWPLDLTEWKDGVFGYIMDLRPEGYYEISDFMLKNVSFSSYRVTVEAALRIVSAYRILHNKGYCYQDLNDGNFFINPRNGHVLICDNDNVAPNKQETGILGKPRYMAPEIVTRQSMPDSNSDIFSMSVILFILFTLNHPLEGKHSLVPALTPKLQEKLYGTEALFIMDEENRDNGPDPVIHRNTLTVWPLLPDYMQKLFSQAFSQRALKEPKFRPKEVEWLKGLVRFKSDIVSCSCGNEIFMKPGKPCKCENCRNTVKIPYMLKFHDYNIPGIAGNMIYKCQIVSCGADDALTPIGEIIAKKSDAAVLGLRNLSKKSWNVVTPSGKAKRVTPEEGGIPLKDGIRFSVNMDEMTTDTIEIIEN